MYFGEAFSGGKKQLLVIQIESLYILNIILEQIGLVFRRHQSFYTLRCLLLSSSLAVTILILQIIMSSKSPQQADPGSSVVFFEANPQGKTISSSTVIDCYTAEISFCTLQKRLYRALQALRTLCWLFIGVCCARDAVLHMKEMNSTWAPVSFLLAAGDKRTIQLGSAERSQCYSVSGAQKGLLYFPIEAPSEHA